MDKKAELFRGCLLGLAVGDAMGYPIDKKSWSEISEDYGPNGLLGYDLVNGSAEITSYTQLAAFVCNGLLLGALRGNPDNYPKFQALGLREWSKSQQVRTNEKTFCWLLHVPSMRRRLCMDTRMLDALSRQTLANLKDPYFFSNTPCALTAAVGAGLVCDPEQTAQICLLGAEALAATHGDPETFLCGAFIACSISLILHRKDLTMPKLFTLAAETVQNHFAETYPQAKNLTEKIAKAIALTKDPELTPLAAMALMGCTTAPECCAAAVYCSVIHAANFDEAMIAAVNHSGRSSAVGALTGAFLGARLGVEALPEFYLESLETAPVLSEMAEDLSVCHQVMRVFDDSWDQKYVQGHPAV